jgi:hypothetical protein
MFRGGIKKSMKMTMANPTGEIGECSRAGWNQKGHKVKTLSFVICWHACPYILALAASSLYSSPCNKDEQKEEEQKIK